MIMYLVLQVCQAVAASARPSLHRPQVSRTSLLLQADRGHAHRHLPHGDAGGPPPDHMTPVMWPPPHPTPPLLVSVYTPEMSVIRTFKKKKIHNLIQVVKWHILYQAQMILIIGNKLYFTVYMGAKSRSRGDCKVCS